MNNKRTSWKKIALSVLCVILSIILIFLIAVAVFMDRVLSMIRREDPIQSTLSSDELAELLKPDVTRGEDFTGPTFDYAEITMPPEASEIIESSHTINILLIGQDRRTNSGRSLSDSMILCTINKQKKTLTMTSFLRDTYVQIPGYGNNKLNVPYPIGGMALLDKTLQVNFGVHVDGNVEVDFSQFSKIVDYLGGVDIELTYNEAVHLNEGYGFALRQGMNHLNGEQALAYSRIRYIGTDFGRANRQRTVLTALLNQFRNASLAQLTETLTGILGLITTDMSDAQILKYATELAPLLKDLKIVSQTIPVEGSYHFGDVSDYNIVDCIFIDFEVNRKLLADTLGE